MRVYLFIGTHLPELGECLRFLAGADPEGAPVTVLAPAGIGWPAAATPVLTPAAWQPGAEEVEFDPGAQGTCFVVLDPGLSPVPQLEQLAGALRASEMEPVKVVTCVDCTAAAASGPLRAYYDACIYYSDIVLLGNRAGASNAFVREFQEKYAHDCYPCLFMLLKGPGHPTDPIEILTPGTRRLSQLFDLAEEGGAEEVPGLVIESSFDLDLEDGEADPFRSPAGDAAPAPVPDASPWIVPFQS